MATLTAFLPEVMQASSTTLGGLVLFTTLVEPSAGSLHTEVIKTHWDLRLRLNNANLISPWKEASGEQI